MSEALSILLPPPTVLLGQKLNRLSIGHILWLERLECLPIKDPDSLITATLVCSHNYEEILPLLQSPWLDWKIKLWSWRLGKVDWEEKYEIWEDYWKLNTAAPLVIQNKDDASLDTHNPFLIHLRVTLMKDLGYSPSEVMDCPFSQALVDYYTLHEILGAVTIRDREESENTQEWLEDNREDIMEAYKKHQAEMELKAKEREAKEQNHVI